MRYKTDSYWPRVNECNLSWLLKRSHCLIGTFVSEIASWSALNYELQRERRRVVGRKWNFLRFLIYRQDVEVQ